MSLDARLHRLMPMLTAKERGVLVLRSWKEGTPEDPQWRSSMPGAQAREFNRYIGLMNACNVNLSGYIDYVESLVEKLELRLGWWLSLWAWRDQIDEAAAAVQRLLPAGQRRTPAYRALRKTLAPMPADPEECHVLPDALAYSLEDVLLTSLPLRWAELRIAEIVVAEVAEEFDGEDPLRPVLRETIDATKKKVTDILVLLECPNCPLPELAEPEDSEIQIVREKIQHWAAA